MFEAINKESVERYIFQQSEIGKQALKVSEQMKQAYIEELKIPASAFSIGKLRPCVNDRTGDIEKFFVED